jgi:RNA polymerase sigma-70 factor (ECF subfamily)
MNFEDAVLPHLDAAYNLARWLTRNEHDAQDVVQEAFLRALRFFGGFQGPDGRAWLLTIVRNTCYTWLRRNRLTELSADFDEAVREKQSAEPDPETQQVLKAQTQLVNDAIAQLPVEFREAVVLRELEELSYKEIAAVTGVPIGTVMSRLARARKRLHESLRELISVGNNSHMETVSKSERFIEKELRRRFI